MEQQQREIIYKVAMTKKKSALRLKQDSKKVRAKNILKLEMFMGVELSNKAQIKLNLKIN